MEIKLIVCKLFQIIFVSAASLLLTNCGKSTSSSKPNIVIILVDDLGWKDVGCYGNDYYETPNIDRLAEQGMRFANGYSAAAVCSPTRGSVMTGRYPTRLGITDWIHHWYKIENEEQPSGYESSADKILQTPKNHLFLDHDETTLAEILKKVGYTTAHIGKWHLGQKKWYPNTHGFDFNIGGFEMGQPPSYFSPYKIPTLPDRKKNEYLTDREANEASEFIKKAVSAKDPFFLYMSHYAVHTPIQAKEEIIDYYKKKEIPSDKEFHPEYASMVHSLDEAVGKILSTIDTLGIADNTIIIFTSDNGGLKLPRGDGDNYFWTDNSPLRAGKGFPYEGGIRVPFIVKWPEHIKPGTLSNQLVSSIDIFPTICEITGQTLPDEKPIDGKSLIPTILYDQNIKRKTLYWHFPHYWGGGVPPYSAVRDGDWKLIRWYENNANELYNLKEDPSEKNNLSELYPEKLKELSKTLDLWLEETGGKIPKINPNYIEEKIINHLATGKNIILDNSASTKYSNGDKNSLVDGKIASASLNDGWIGFEGKDLMAVIDLDSSRSIHTISINFMQNHRDWIFLPKKVVISGSKNGKLYSTIKNISSDVAEEEEGLKVKNFSIEIADKEFRFIKIHAQNIETCPPWHQGAGNKAWIFTDEILIH